ncbi:MAG: hypothetical protein AAGG75_27750, partial [Bacteroidota bacterium]
MDITQVKATIDANINEQGQLILNDALFPEMAELLDAIHNNNILITIGEMTVRGKGLFIKGKVDFMGLENLSAQLIFKATVRSLKIALRIELPPNWNFKDSFPNLPPSLKPVEGQPGEYDYGDSALTDLNFHTAFFVLKNSLSSKEPYFKKGLNFSGFPENFLQATTMSTIFPVDASTNLSGSITLHPGDSMPDFSLYLSFPVKDINFGPLKITDLRQRYHRVEPPVSDYQQTELQAVGNIVIGATRPVTLEVASPLNPGSSVFNFYGQSPDNSATLSNGLAALNELLGLPANAIKLPQELGVINKAVLHYFSAIIDAQTKRVRRVDFSIGLPVQWEVIKDRLTLEDIKVGIAVLNPSPAAKRKINVLLGGTFSIATTTPVHLEAVVTTDDGVDLVAQMRQGEKFPLIAGFNKLTGASIDLPGDLVAERLYFHAVPKAKNYQFKFSVAGDWALLPGIMDLALKRISIEVDQKAGRTTGLLAGQLNIAGIDLFLKAALPTAGAGWNLSGKSGQDQNISLSSLVQELISKLNIQLPFDIPGVQLRNLSAEVNTKTKNFALSGESMSKMDFPIGDISFDVFATIHLNVTRDATTGAKQLTGSVSGELDIAGQIFSIGYKMGKGDKTISAAWAAKGDESLGINDVLKALGLEIIELPDALEVTLKSIAFEFDTSSKSLRLMAASKQFGKVFFVSQRSSTSNKRAYVFGLEFPPNFKLSDIPGLGSELNGADFMSFRQTALIVSSDQVSNLVIPQLPMLANTGTLATEPFVSDQALTLSQGLNVTARINLNDTEDASMKNLQSATKLKELLLQAAVGRRTLHFRANLDSSIKFKIGSNALEFRDPHIRIDILPIFGLQLVGGLMVEMNDVNLLAEGGLVISPVEVSARLMVSAHDPDAEGATASSVGTANLLGPLGIKGIQLNSIGMIIGATFAPPAMKFGFQTGFAIGDQAPSSNEMAMVLQIIPAAPSPVVNVILLTFELAEIDIETALTVFTNDNAPDLPAILRSIRATEVGFYYCQAPTTLPDGNTAIPGFGFNGNVNLFGFTARAHLMINMLSGIEGHFQTAPIHINAGNVNILSVTGKGEELSNTFEKKDGKWIKVDNQSQLLDFNGNETPPETKTEILVAAGGPVLQFSTLGPKFLYASVSASFLDLLKMELEAEVSTSGISFFYSVTNGLTFLKASFTVKTDGFKADGSMGVDLDIDIKLKEPTTGVNLGTIDLDTGFEASTKIEVNQNGYSQTIKGSFHWESLKINLPTITIKVTPDDFAALAKAIGEYILNHAWELFKQFFDSIEKWLNAAKDGLIKVGKAVGQAAEDLAKGLKAGFDATAEEATKAFKALDYGAKEVGKALKEGFGTAAKETAEFLKDVGYEVKEVGETLKNVFGSSAKEAAQFLKDAGYTARQVGDVLKNTFGAAAQEVSKLMKAIGYNATEIADILKSQFGAAARDVAKFLKGAGYTAAQVGATLKSAFGTAAQDAARFLKNAGYAAEQVGEALKDTFGSTAAQAAKVMKNIGYGAEQVGEALKDTFNQGAQQAAKLLKDAGYLASDVGKALKNKFGTAAKDAAKFLKGAGYAASQVGDTLKNTFRT